MLSYEFGCLWVSIVKTFSFSQILKDEKEKEYVVLQLSLFYFIILLLYLLYLLYYISCTTFFTTN